MVLVPLQLGLLSSLFDLRNVFNVTTSLSVKYTICELLFKLKGISALLEEKEETSGSKDLNFILCLN